MIILRLSYISTKNCIFVFLSKILDLVMTKNQNKLFTVLIFTFFFGICNLNSQPIMPNFIKKNKDATKKQWFDFRINIDINSAAMRYDKDGNDIVADSVIGNYIDSLGVAQEYEYNYTTDFSQQKYNLQFGFLGVKNLFLYAKFPLVHTSIIEKLKLENDPELTERFIRNEKTETFWEGMQLYANYCFDLNFMNVTVLGGMFIPFEKYNSKSKSIDDFDGRIVELGRVFETSVGARFDFHYESIRLQLGGLYNQRCEDFSDRLLLNFLVGLSSVENTELFANFIYVNSLVDYQESYQINFWRQPLWENYFDMDLGFSMFFTDEFYVNLGYSIRIWGENTLSLKTVKINLGYTF
jgi:hypothetical protein